jgi:hypothetical protein
MLTRISAITAALAAIVNVAVLLGWDLDTDQVAAINTAIVLVGSAIHAWLNPGVPFGKTDG